MLKVALVAMFAIMAGSAHAQVRAPAYLTRLSVNGESLSPKFNRSVAEYSAVILGNGSPFQVTAQGAYNTRISMFLNGVPYQWGGSTVPTKRENMLVIQVTFGANIISYYRVKITSGEFAGLTPSFKDLNPPVIFGVNHRSSLLADGRVLTTGGFTETQPAIGRVLLFDPVSESWSHGADMFPRGGHTQTVLPNGKVLITGGAVYNASLVFYDRADIYDPVTNSWSNTAPMKYRRMNHHAVLLENGKVLIFGGLVNDVGFRECEIYDPQTETWSSTGPMFNGSLFPVVTLNDGRIISVGGELSRDRKSTVEIYDPQTGRWTLGASPLDARSGYTASLLPNGKVLITGGTIYSSNVESSELYDPATNQWEKAPAMANRRSHHTATTLQNGRVMVCNGHPRNSVEPKWTAEFYDPVTGLWDDHVRPGLAPLKVNFRTRHTATLLNDGRILLMGGKEFSDGTGVMPGAQLVSFVKDPIEVSNGSQFIPGGGILQFGHTVAPGSRLKTLTLSNPYDHVISWYPDFRYGGNPVKFSVNPGAKYSLAPGESTSLTLSFDPDGVGSRHALLNLYVQGSGRDIVFPISLTGTGATALSAYEEWSRVLPSEGSAPGGIPHGDGVENLLKYAFNMSTNRADVRTVTSGGLAGLPSVTMIPGESKKLRLEYLRRKNSGLVYIPQYGTTLDDFIPMTATPVVTSIDDQWERVVVEQTITTPAAFARVKVKLP